ncbi:MAG TPA: hypothetical protein VE133_19765 [Candidatus Sulfotelmatobacter sp.]|nr:hypothetical protein [Candidatus Sulfotelmatobacter sp.]
MMFDLITIFLVTGVLMVAGYTAIQFRGKFPKRTIDDVTPFLRPAEAFEFESLLDPAQEVNFRLRLSPVEFAAWQRKRFHLMQEYLLRMSHNALVLIEWGNMEAFEEKSLPQQGQKQLLAQELVQAATEFRLYSMLALFKLKMWLLLPSFFLPGLAPSTSRLRNLFGINALGSYKRLKTAAGTLGLAYSNAFEQDLLARL